MRRIFRYGSVSDGVLLLSAEVRRLAFLARTNVGLSTSFSTALNLASEFVHSTSSMILRANAWQSKSILHFPVFALREFSTRS